MCRVSVHLLLLSVVIGTIVGDRVHLERTTPLDIPQDWKLVESENKDVVLHLTIALRLENTDVLEQLFRDVSNPKSPKYGHYLSNDDITALVGIPTVRITAVRNWLEAYGGRDISLSKNRDFIAVKMTVENAERMLEVKYSKFVHKTGHVVHKSLYPYSIPAHLREHIAFVGGVHRFPNLSHRKLPVFSGPRNDPVISYFVPGDGELSLFLGIRCSDGLFAKKNTVCPDGQNFIGVRALLEYNDVSSKLDVTNLNCLPCSEWTGVYFEKCNYTITIFNQNATALFCQHSIENVPNYASISLSLTTLYSSTTSDTYKYPADIILSGWITPQKLQDYYGIGVGYSNNLAGNSQAVAEFLEQYYSDDDLKRFFLLMGLKNQPVSKVVGPNNPLNPGGEASLDIQYIMGVARNVSTEFWSVPGRNSADQEPFLQWLQILEGTDNPPLVHSVSYADLEFQLSADYITRVEYEFMKAGARGISILFASGDDGCGGYLLRDNATLCSKSFFPGWPSTSPHVTTVGGTQFLTGTLPFCSTRNCGEVGEVVSSSRTGSRITSGGGFSNFFGIPDYQADAVNYWLNEAETPPISFFNSSGRAYPDISGVAHNYLVVLSSELIGVDGTSASTPLVAAMITLLNEIQISKGKQPLGFLNPWIYQTASSHPEAFYDIVVGENGCSADPSNCCPFSFKAAPGWDPVTGVGSPKFNVLKQLLP